MWLDCFAQQLKTRKENNTTECLLDFAGMETQKQELSLMEIVSLMLCKKWAVHLCVFSENLLFVYHQHFAMQIQEILAVVSHNIVSQSPIV